MEKYNESIPVTIKSSKDTLNAEIKSCIKHRIGMISVFVNTAEEKKFEAVALQGIGNSKRLTEGFENLDATSFDGKAKIAKKPYKRRKR